MKYQEFYSLYSSAIDSPNFERFVADEGLPPCFADYPDEQIMHIFKAIWALRDNPTRGIKTVCGLTNKAISERYRIPIRTVENRLAKSSDGVRGANDAIMLAYCVFVDEEII